MTNLLYEPSENRITQRTLGAEGEPNIVSCVACGATAGVAQRGGFTFYGVEFVDGSPPCAHWEVSGVA